MNSAETQSKIDQFRRMDPAKLSRDDSREIVRLLRQDRANAADASKSAGVRKSSAKPMRSVDDMLGGL